MSAGRAWRAALALAALVVVADQGAKALVEANVVVGEQIDVVGPVAITLTHNEGVAFGVAAGGGVALVAITLAALALVGGLFARDPGRPGMWIAAGLLAGGALGNLADRVRAGAVTDYVEVGSWPAFNLADVAITLGVALLAWSLLREPEGTEETP